jgi:hypothetical protein
VRLLLTAIRRFQPTPGHLTNLHGVVFRIALSVRRPNLVRSLLDTPVTTIDAKSMGITSIHFLLYAYYGGMLQALLKNYDEALILFQQVRKEM